MKTKITLLISVFILFLLVPSISVAQITNVPPIPHSTYHKGDSYTTKYFPSEIIPQKGTEQPKIQITSLVNNTIRTSNNLTLTFNLTSEAPTNYHSYSPYHPINITLQGICYKPSWQSDNITIDFGSNNQLVNKTLPFSVNFTNMADGPKTVTIYASALYEFETGRENVRKPVSPSGMIVGNFLYVYSNYYFMEGSSSVDFTINTSPTPTETLDKNSAANNGIGTLLYPVILTIILVFVIALVVLVFLQKRRELSSKQSF